MNAIKSRISQLIEEENISVAEFERRSGLSNGYTRNFKGNLGAEKLEGILRGFPSLSRDWLLYGEGSMLKGEVSALAIDPKDVKEVNEGEGIAVYDADFACGFVEFLDEVNYPIGYYSIPPYNDPDKYCIVRATGDSMLPTIADKAFVVIGKRPLSVDEIIFGDVYAVETTADMRTIKRVTRSDDRTCVRLVPDNQAPIFGSYQDFSKEKIRACYKVFASINVTSL